MSETIPIEERCAKLERCLLPVWMGLCEHAICDGALPDDAVVLHFMGSGASDQVTAGMIYELFGRPAIEQP